MRGRRGKADPGRHPVRAAPEAVENRFTGLCSLQAVRPYIRPCSIFIVAAASCGLAESRRPRSGRVARENSPTPTKRCDFFCKILGLLLGIY